MLMKYAFIIATSLQMGLACSNAARDDAAPSLTVNVAALNLAAVRDVVWDLEVVNGANPPSVVWHERITSSRFGNGLGAATYIGTCDASPDARDNSVRLWVVGVYGAPVAVPGVFGSAPPPGAIAFQNPTPYDAVDGIWDPPLSQIARCKENGDTPVQFDVALMRPAQQGFFDIAVNFNDIFCSAKFDCCVENASGNACASDLTLLFDDEGQRQSTMVLGFACTGGVGNAVDTTLYFDALELDCSNPAAGFDADLTLNPAGQAGNQCTPGNMSGCAVVTEEDGVDADTYLYQMAVYRGLETLTSGDDAANKVYWNVALGVHKPAIGACRLRARATADDALGTSITDNGVIAAGVVYPFVQFDVDLATCQAEPLGSAMVSTQYTGLTDGATEFTYGYGANALPGRFCTPECVHGTCIDGTCDCDEGFGGPGCAIPDCGVLGQCPAGFTCAEERFCVSDAGADEVYVPAGMYWRGCNTVTDGNCFGQEYPQHPVALSAYSIDRTKVTAAAYKACVNAGACATPQVTGGQQGTFAPPEKQSHPINYVSWYESANYCAWRGKRLCTEGEWERAARGGCETVSGDCRTSMRKYPWGNYEPSGCNEAAWQGCPSGLFTSDAAGFPGGASPYGALGMSGNLMEWTSDLFAEYQPQLQTNPQGPNPGDPGVSTGRVLRSGKWNDEGRYIRASTRSNQPPAVLDSYIGFRCCRSQP